MNYIELCINLKTESISDVLTAELADLDFESFVNENFTLKAYIQNDKYQQELVNEALKPYMDSIADIEVHEIPHQNWNAVWESGYEPVLIEDDIYIRASFHAAHPTATYQITLEPNMSFGTGHHPTTHLMLSAIKSITLEGKSMCDFGCGSGILAIYAAMKGAQGLAIEIDPHATEAARQNFAVNGVQNFKLLNGDIQALSGNYDLIAANINRNVIEESLDKFKQHLKPNGILLCAGFLNDDTQQLSDIIRNAGFKITSTNSLNGWTLIQSQSTV